MSDQPPEEQKPPSSIHALIRQELFALVLLAKRGDYAGSIETAEATIDALYKYGLDQADEGDRKRALDLLEMWWGLSDESKRQLRVEAEHITTVLEAFGFAFDERAALKISAARLQKRLAEVLTTRPATKLYDISTGR